ncbi:hypothetical protein AB5I41_26225 [Sphingomonas sp. MMS24-JH45]
MAASWIDCAQVRGVSCSSAAAIEERDARGLDPALAGALSATTGAGAAGAGRPVAVEPASQQAGIGRRLTAATLAQADLRLSPTPSIRSPTLDGRFFGFTAARLDGDFLLVDKDRLPAWSAAPTARAVRRRVMVVMGEKRTAALVLAEPGRSDRRQVAEQSPLCCSGSSLT